MYIDMNIAWVSHISSMNDIVSMQDIVRAMAGEAKEEKIDPRIFNHMKIECQYAHYLKLQAKEIEMFRQGQKVKLPLALDYSQFGSITHEERDKLQEHQPVTIYAASRISGIRTSTLIFLYQFAQKKINQTRQQPPVVHSG